MGFVVDGLMRNAAIMAKSADMNSLFGGVFMFI